MHTLTLTLALAFLFLPSSARVIWTPEEFDPLAEVGTLTTRDVSACGGVSGLSQCGGDLPSDFCCPASTTCLALDTSSSVLAAICCPAGQDCSLIGTVSCEQSLQNATANPKSQLHSKPTQQLSVCGSGCCPMGYTCKNDQCHAAVPPAVPAASLSSTTVPSGTSGPTSFATSTATAKPTAVGSSPVEAHRSKSSDSSSDFDGKWFAAGLVPGIAIGAFLAALLLFLCCFRKRRYPAESYVDEKIRNRDTLTTLGPQQPSRRPTVHGRSISEPCADVVAGHRTDFLRGTPPKDVVPTGPNQNGYTVEIQSPASDSITPLPRVKALFSRSPFMNQTPSTPRSTQPPIPGHLKRGTLSFKISPVRALKKQKSTHSLRRQMTDASRLPETSRNNSRRVRPERSRSGSTETIQVLMPSNEPYTPDRVPQMAEDAPTLGSATYQPPPKSAGSTWNTTSSADDSQTQQPLRTYADYASSSRYPSEQPTYATPTRPPVARRNSNGGIGDASLAFLGSPYTPTNQGGGLAPQRADTRRDTTFSAMMERAGLRKSDLVVKTGKK